MPAYFISSVEVTDDAAFQDDRRLAGPAVAAYGGRFLARGSMPRILEGESVIEFPDEDAARRLYESPEYQDAQANRANAALFNAVVIAGV